MKLFPVLALSLAMLAAPAYAQAVFGVRAGVAISNQYYYRLPPTPTAVGISVSGRNEWVPGHFLTVFREKKWRSAKWSSRTSLGFVRKGFATVAATDTRGQVIEQDTHNVLDYFILDLAIKRTLSPATYLALGIRQGYLFRYEVNSRHAPFYTAHRIGVYEISPVLALGCYLPWFERRFFVEVEANPGLHNLLRHIEGNKPRLLNHTVAFTLGSRF
ncbi:MAG: hypothetical protein MUC97_17875 [Bernardetiaceae bacterium]|jgi:hypothetical protein|nr:hypothetical protein [Bernardetiaceae bacterium]